MASLNLKLQSVKLDCQSAEVQSLARALGIIYASVTGPFWNMLSSDIQYVDQYLYIQTMLNCFKEWAEDSTVLLNLDNLPTVFPYHPEFSVKQNQVIDFLKEDSGYSHLTKKALEHIMRGFMLVTERQLVDFLPGGNSEVKWLRTGVLK